MLSKVSIITITYNIVKAGRSEMLRQCIESVHNQTYDNIEHIIIDGASDDGTLDIIKEYADKGWLSCHSEPDTGIYNAMNKGIRFASGEYVAFLNSDDFWHDNRGIEESIKYLEKENADFSYSNCYYLDEQDNIVCYFKSNIASFYERMPFCHQTMFTKRECLLNLNGFNEEYKSAADYDLVLRLILSGAKGVFVPLNFTSYRLIGLSTVHCDDSAKECLKIFEKLHKELGFSAEDSVKCWNLQPRRDFIDIIKQKVELKIGEAVEKQLEICPLDSDGYYTNKFVPLIKKIRVVYDATLLHAFYSNGDSRTGIFFVVYNVLIELLKRPELDVAVYCEEWAKANILRLANEDKKNFSNLTFFEGDIENFDIFFSPIFKIPEQIKRSGICCFTFFYDLIAYLYPEFNAAAADPNSWFMQLINSFDKDDYIFTISDHTKSDLVSHIKSVDPSKVTTVYLAANEKFYLDSDEKKHILLRKKYNIPLDKKYIFSLCTLEPRKNLIFTIKNFISFIKKNDIKDLVFVLGGGSWESFIKQLDEEIDNLDEYKKYIIKTGYIDDCDLASLYSHAECTAYMSLYEGFGLPVLEAMQCGCPVISSNTSSLPEVTGDAGIMLDPVDNDAMISAFEKIYFDKDFCKVLSEKSLKRAALFSWKKTADIITNCFMLTDTNRMISPIVSESKIVKPAETAAWTSPCLTINLFGVFPFIKIKYESNQFKFFLFNLILFRVKNYNNKKKIYLFNFLPFFTIKK